MKAQSAIEYLTTYGWMLIIIAIVGGALYNIYGPQCLQGTSGFQTNDVAIQDMGFTSDKDIGLVLRNNKGEDIEVKEIIAETEERERTYNISKIISSGQTTETSLNAFERTESCKEIELEIVYSLGSLNQLKTSGVMVGQFDFNEEEFPQSLDALNVNY